jgi:hypothetical protein
MNKNKKNIPNLFIVGAPKCGTTSLAYYLGEHPDIFMCEPKEPNYFARHLFTDYQLGKIKFHQYTYKIIFNDYLKLFDNVKEEVVVGEASTRYIRSEKALKEIKNLNKNAKIIAMIRNPVDLVFSWYKQKTYERQENILNFEKAWHIELEREQGKCLPTKLWAEDELFYRKIGSLGTQVETLLTIFSKQQVHLILFDDFIKKPQKVYAEVLSFLELPDDGRKKFPAKNIQKNINFQNVYTILSAIRKEKYLIRVKKNLEKIIGIDLPGIKKTTDRICISKKSTGDYLNKQFRKILTDYFCKEIKKIEVLANRDLSTWLKH